MKPEILDRLCHLINEKLNKVVLKECYNMHLLGQVIKFAPRDLLYLFFFIQQEFDIVIDKKYILDGSFSTMNNIVDIIYDSIQHRETTGVQ